ncbi:MAG: hypothetical protein JXA54_15400 [Candidatus Heimdallarchaeota archaeon]|nr:hypothetical protein [Candidatus Heimdallarchaeota archaeon]
MKEFNYKPSDGKDPTKLSESISFGEPSTKISQMDPSIQKTRVEKDGSKVKEMNNVNIGLLKIGKLVLIISSIILIIRVSISTIAEIVFAIEQSYYFFNLVSFNGAFIYKISTVFGYIGIVALICNCVGLFLITFSLENADRKNFLIASIIYGAYIILRIIRMFISPYQGLILGWINFGSPFLFGYNYGRLILNILAVLLLITMVLFLNIGIKKLQNKYLMQIKPFTIYIALIVFLILQIVLAILSVANATDIFAVVLYYVKEVLEICFLLTFLTIYARLMKLRKIEFV